MWCLLLVVVLALVAGSSEDEYDPLTDSDKEGEVVGKKRGRVEVWRSVKRPSIQTAIADFLANGFETLTVNSATEPPAPRLVRFVVVLSRGRQVDFALQETDLFSEVIPVVSEAMREAGIDVKPFEVIRLGGGCHLSLGSEVGQLGIDGYRLRVRFTD